MTEVNLKNSPTGYNLVPPPGWEQIELQSDSLNETLLGIVDRSMNELPHDLPKDDITRVRMELFKQLKKGARKAARGNGHMLYMPVERVQGTFIPASFVISKPLDGPGSSALTQEVMGAVAGDRGDSEPVEVDGARGIRIEYVAPPQEDIEAQFASRRVEYVLPVPGSPTPRWLTINFSAVGDGNPDSEFSDALVSLFDAVMTTFRWSYA
ncbi:hypothetical protein [Streptomyces griseomycini]|uniref:Uncharacterized protein n=1 Tax=Streptomyces griseomycini TaxID=66895 RepID=A0A7W7LX73_9ACTN|nr:hypothetical protein [Streptomyces griseomycini]MBB4897742.1 hypothetical protein [Streptomyces griseomycini]GGR11696.1 hypothetical protein GCM10015536_16500 [Streptomyces griseomycini]